MSGLQRAIEEATVALAAMTVGACRKIFEDTLTFLRLVSRGWRVIAVFMAFTISFGIIYLARVKPSYQATTRTAVNR